jgi:hypothetical protein
MNSEFMPARMKVVVDKSVSEEEILGLPGRLKSMLWRPRRRVGQREFSARLFKYRLFRAGTPIQIGVVIQAATAATKAPAVKPLKRMRSDAATSVPHVPTMTQHDAATGA